ncbi:hypothetical protein ACFE6N_01500 [Pedobacter sp. BG31]|uniref:hypothetical protein n=1 Tax=Pedobacter sp. BG31 TaxID=3349697 RepID=UPI0035F4C81B
MNVNSTWVPVQSASINNGAKAYIEAINKVYGLGNGYVMGFKTSSDATYENFWNRTFDSLTGAVIGAVSGGGTAAIEGILGSIFGGVVVDQLNGLVPTSTLHSEVDKLRNDIVLDILQQNSIANYTPGMTMGGTIRFTSIDLSPIALTIDMKDLMNAVKDHMKRNDVYNDSSGEINENGLEAYKTEFKQLVDGSGSMIEIMHRLGYSSTRTDSGQNTGGGGSSHGSGGGLGQGSGSNYQSPTGPGYTEPLPDGTYYPSEGFEQPEFFFYNQVPIPENDPAVTSAVIEYVNPTSSNVNSGIYTDENGVRWILYYCDQIQDPSNTDGYGLSMGTWAASKLP